LAFQGASFDFTILRGISVFSEAANWQNGKYRTPNEKIFDDWVMAIPACAVKLIGEERPPGRHYRYQNTIDRSNT
jgi:hypothetical protein